MSDYIQTGFQGGLNRQFDPTRIGRNEYPLLVNGRSRSDALTPILDAVRDSSLPAGVMQGVYAAGAYVLIFISGNAFLKNFNFPLSNFQQIAGFAMDPAAETIYAELVPASSLNYARVPFDGDVNGIVNLRGVASASPSAVVCQDGVSQARLIFPTGLSRIAQTYNQWAMDNREYVPIGRQMMYNSGILYIVSPDGREIFRSVTGRPLDFMVNIDPNGDKLATEQLGGAQSVSYKVDYDPISCIARLPTSPDSIGSFYVGTVRTSYRVTPDFENTIFGEPQFDNDTLFPTGPLNQFSFSDVVGDQVLIDFNGLRSFNAIQQARNEGRNMPFSARIYPLIQGIVQMHGCIGKFDNYALFGLDTIYGPAIGVYDELQQRWIAIDQYTGVGVVKQFCEVRTGATRKLFFITSDNGFYEAFAAPTVAPASIYVGDFCTNDPKIGQKNLLLRVVFNELAGDSGTVTITPFVNGKRQTQSVMTKDVTPTAVAQVPPIAIPFGAATEDRVRHLSFDCGRTMQGWQLGFLITWDFFGNLSHLSLSTDDETQDNTLKEQATSFAEWRA